MLNPDSQPFDVNVIVYFQGRSEQRLKVGDMALQGAVVGVHLRLPSFGIQSLRVALIGGCGPLRFLDGAFRVALERLLLAIKGGLLLPSRTLLPCDVSLYRGDDAHSAPFHRIEQSGKIIVNCEEQ